MVTFVQNPAITFRRIIFSVKTFDKCPVDWDNSTVPEYEDNFWISCPKDSNGNDVFPKPDTFISVGLIFLSSILQRWGVYIFDMAATQLFQVTVPMNERNRVAAGQFRSGSLTRKSKDYAGPKKSDQGQRLDLVN